MLYPLIPISLGLRPTFTDGILVCVIPVLSQHIQVHTGSRPFCCVIFHLFMAPSALGSRTPLLAYSKTRPRGPYYRSGLNKSARLDLNQGPPHCHLLWLRPTYSIIISGVGLIQFLLLNQCGALTNWATDRKNLSGVEESNLCQFLMMVFASRLLYGSLTEIGCVFTVLPLHQPPNFYSSSNSLFRCLRSFFSCFSIFITLSSLLPQCLS